MLLYVDTDPNPDHMTPTPRPPSLQRLANTAVITDWGAVQRMYPELYDFLGMNKNTACPSAISLGPAGSYFINVEGRTSFRCHPLSQILSEAEDASRLWWGANGAYVLEFNGVAKQVIWDLKGQYGALEAILGSRREDIKVSEKETSCELNTAIPPSSFS